LEVSISIKTIHADKGRTLGSEDEGESMKKPKLTLDEEMKLNILRDSIDRYENLLQWQRIRKAERKLLELRLRYDYRSYRREALLDKYLVSLRYKKPKGPLSEED
jgi:hypothetical protein